MVEQNCGSCGSPASLLCGGCGEVSYCSKDHQKSAWKAGHKQTCKAYKIETHPDFGRYLVASRDLKPGSRILTKLKPAVIGPPIFNAFALMSCMNCSKIVDKPVYCSNCRYSFCSNRCKCDSENSELCSLLGKLEDKNNQKLVSTLKFLMLKKSDNDLYKKLLQLESHVKELQESSFWKKLLEGVIEPLKKLEFNEDEISQALGIICTNSFELLHKPGKGAPPEGLFEIASLMNHDCIGNTR